MYPNQPTATVRERLFDKTERIIAGGKSTWYTIKGSSTRYSESDVQEIEALLASETKRVAIEELEKVANHNNSEYTSDYLEARITELKSQLKETK